MPRCFLRTRRLFALRVVALCSPLLLAVPSPERPIHSTSPRVLLGPLCLRGGVTGKGPRRLASSASLLGARPYLCMHMHVEPGPIMRGWRRSPRTTICTWTGRTGTSIPDFTPLRAISRFRYRGVSECDLGGTHDPWSHLGRWPYPYNAHGFSCRIAAEDSHLVVLQG